MKRYPNRKFRSQPLQIICLSPNSPSSRFLKSLMHTTHPAPIQMRSMLPSIHILHPRTPNMRHLRELPHTLESPRLLLRHRLTTHDSAGHIHTTHSLHLLYLLHMELLLRLLLLLLHNHAKTHFLSFLSNNHELPGRDFGGIAAILLHEHINSLLCVLAQMVLLCLVLYGVELLLGVWLWMTWLPGVLRG